MSKDFQVERHAKLLEEKTKQVKRVYVGSLLFGVLILANVLTPYSSNINKRIEVEADVALYEQEIQEIEKPLNLISELEGALADVQALVARRPWAVETEKLIERFREMNQVGGASRSDYQQVADAMVHKVAGMVEDTVIEPLNRFLAEPSISDELLPGLADELRTVPAAVEEWESEHEGQRWYGTIDEKELHMRMLSATIWDKLRSISRLIDRVRPNLVAERERLATELKEKKNDPKLLAAEKKLKDLQEKMDTILPSWIRGMISVEQMAQIFPFIAVILAAYSFSLSISVARHYRFLARVLGFGPVERSDPDFSSMWTLTFRGTFGTLLTIAVYIFFFAAMWFFFETGVDILVKSGHDLGVGFLGMSFAPTVWWLARVLLAGLAICTAVRPYYQHRGEQAA